MQTAANETRPEAYRRKPRAADQWSSSKQQKRDVINHKAHSTYSDVLTHQTIPFIAPSREPSE